MFARYFPRFPRRTYATYKRFQPTEPLNVARLVSNRTFLYLVGGGAAFYAYNLDEAPVTHRLRFLWVPYWLEKKIGDYSYRQIMYQYGSQLAPATDPQYRQTTRVMNRLLAAAIASTKDPKQAAHLKLLPWLIQIIDGPEPPNAFILPNGKIFIFSLIFPICQTDDGLATVLAHELSHQLAHHSLEQLSKQPVYIGLSTLLYAATGISWFNDLLIAGLLQMPSLREMESEADRIGCEIMARLCYNVNAAVGFWSRMEAWEQRAKRGGLGISSGVLTDFLSTHPNTQKRITDIRKWLPEMQQISEANCGHGFHDAARNFFGKAY